MSETIDNKVVKMEFDNRQFESGVRESLNTIERLKQGLNFGNVVETVKAKFSAMDAAAFTAVQHMTRNIINAGEKMVSALTIDPVKSGFSEYETQIGAIQTILANTAHEGTSLQQVNAVLDELNTYADKTIYNFTEMTRNIGTFTAAGVDLRTSADAIKGIANLAALSGSTSQQASTAMYQLSQALAAGKVQLMDWNSVVNAGMGGKVFQDALIRTSELLGTGAQAAIDSYGSFRESLTKGEWLTTEVLTETLKQFAGAYDEADLIQQGFTEEQAKEIMQMSQNAQDAATKVKTVTQLWDTLKESAQSGWTSTWEIIVGDFGEAEDLFTQISDSMGAIIGAISDYRNEILEGGLSTGWKQLLSEGLPDEAAYIESIQEVAREGGDAFDQLVESSDSFADALKKGLQDGAINSGTLARAVVNLDAKMQNMSEEELKAAGYTADMRMQVHNFRMELIKGTVDMDDFVEKITRPSGRENLIEAAKNTLTALGKVLEPIKEAFNDVFNPPSAGELGDKLYDLTDRIRKMTERFTVSEETADKLTRTFKGLFEMAKLLSDIFGGGFRAAINIVKTVLDACDVSILDITAAMGDYMSKAVYFIRNNETLREVIRRLVEIVKKCCESIKEWFGSLKNSSALQSLSRLIRAFAEDLETYLKGGKIAIDDFLDRVMAMDHIDLDDLKVIFRDFVDNVIGYFADLKTPFDDVIKKVQDFSTKIKEKFDELTGTVDISADDLGTAKDKILEVFNKIREAINEHFDVGTFMSIGMGAGLITIANFFGSVLSEPLEAITNLLDKTATALGKLINAIAKDIKADALLKKSTALENIAKAIMILVASLAALKKLNEDGEIWDAVEVLGALAGGLVAVQAALELINKLFHNSKIKTAVDNKDKKGNIFGSILPAVSQILQMAAAIWVVVKALEEIETLDPDKVFESIAILATIVGGLTAAITLMNSKIKGFDAKNKVVTPFLSLAGGVYLMVKALEELASLDVPADKINETIEALIAIGGSLALLGHGFKDVKIGGGFSSLLIVASVEVFVQIFKQLSELDFNYGKTAIKKFGELIAMLEGLIISTRLAGKDSQADKAGIGALGMTLGIELLIDSVKKINEISKSDIDKAMPVLAGLTGLIDTMILVSNKAGQFGNQAAKLVLASGAATFLLSFAILMLSNLDQEELQNATVAIDSVLAMFALVTDVSQFANGSKDGLKALAKIQKICVLLAVIVGILSFLPTEGLQSASLAMISMTACFDSIILITSRVKGITKQQVEKIKVAQKIFGEIAILAVVVSGILGVLEKFDMAPSIESATAFGELVVALAGSMILIAKAMKSASSSKKTFEHLKDFEILMVSVAGVVTAMTAVLGLLEKYDFAPSIASATAMSELLLALAGAMTILSRFGDTDAKFSTSFGVIMGELALAVSALGGIIGALEKYDVAPSLETVANISILLYSLVNAMNILSTDEKHKQTVSASQIAALGVLTLCVSAIGIIMGIMVSMGADGANCIEIAIAMGLVLGALVKALQKLDDVKSISGWVMGTLALMELALVGIAAIFGIMDALNVEASLETALSLSLTLIALSEAVVILGKYKGTFATSLEAIGVLDLLIADLAGVITGLGALMTDTAFENMDKGIAVFGKIGEAIGSLIGGLVGGALGEMSSALPIIGTNVNTFWTNIKPALDGIKTLDNTVVTGMDIMTKVIGMMVAQTFLGNLRNMMTTFHDPFTDLGNNLESFADAILDFAGKFGDSDEVTRLSQAASAAKTLTDAIGQIDLTGGLWDMILGKVGIDTKKPDYQGFSDGLSVIADGLKSFSTTLGGDFKGDMVNEGAQAIKTLAEACNTDTITSGGVWSWFWGDQDLTAFGSGLTTIATGISDFCNALAGGGEEGGSAVTLDQVNEGAEMIAIMAKACAEVDNSGGAWGWFWGDQDLTTFGNGLGQLGTAIHDFCGNLEGKSSTVDVASKGAEMLKLIAAAVSEIEPSGGLWGKLWGDEDISGFADGIKTLGGAINSFCTNCVGTDTVDFTTAVNNLTSLVELLTTMDTNIAGTEGVNFFIEGLKKLAESGITEFVNKFGEAVPQLTEAAETFVNSFVTAIEDQTETLTSGISTALDTAVTAIEDHGPAFTTAGEDLMTKFISGIKSYDNEASNGSVSSAFVNMLSGCLTKIRDSLTPFKTVGEDIANELSSGFKSKEPNMTAVIRTVIAAMATSAGNVAQSEKGKFEAAAAQLMAGFTSGLKANPSQAQSSIASVVSACLSAITSKASAFRSGGVSLITNLINGIKSNASGPSAAVKSMIDDAIKEVTDAVSRMRRAGEELASALIDGINDATPTPMRKYRTIMNEVVDEIADWEDDMKDAGKDITQAFIDGLSDSTLAAELKQQAEQLAQTASSTANSALNSSTSSSSSTSSKKSAPSSTKTKQKTIDKVSSEKSSLTRVISQVADIVENGIDVTPVIAPVLDLTEVTKGINKLDTMLGAEQAMTINAKMNKEQPEIQNGEADVSTSGGNVFTFEQNNYSPKALSRAEIYRQTKNLFSAAGRMAKA